MCSARFVAWARRAKCKPAATADVRRQFRLYESETANVPQTALIGKVLTLKLGAGQIVEPSVAFPWRIPWSVKSIPSKQTSTHLVKAHFLLVKSCQAQNGGLNSYRRPPSPFFYGATAISIVASPRFY